MHFEVTETSSSIDLGQKYLTSQLITYIGNKRKLLPMINHGIESVRKKLAVKSLTSLDGFAGSGAVSRLLKQHSTHLISNDFEAYAHTINSAYLANKSSVDLRRLEEAIIYLNLKKHQPSSAVQFIADNYAPRDDLDIQLGERVFFTRTNALIIDNLRHLIERDIDHDLQQYCLANLLVKASVHNNTSGVFKSFHKRDGLGHFGGRGESALCRIIREIELSMPVLSPKDCEVKVYCEDINTLANRLEPVDVAYLDPPYNQHPYGSNYFMLNIINGGRPVEIQPGVSGIARTWQRSAYNRTGTAEAALDDVLARIQAKFVLVSYNNEGIIPYESFRAIVSRHGSWQLLEQDYGAYRGARNLSGRSSYVKEQLWIIQKY